MKKIRKIAVLAIIICLCAISLSACITTTALVGKEILSEQPNKNIYYINETATNSDGVNFKILSVKDTKELVFSIFTTYSTQNNYMVIEVQIDNQSDEPFSPNPTNVYLYKGDAKYEYHDSTYSFDNAFTSLDSINPGITKTLNIVFETPSKSIDDEYKIQICSSWLDNGYVTIILQNRK